MHHCLKLLGDDGFGWIGAQLRGWLIEQCQQFDLIQSRFGSVAIAD